VSKKRKEQRPSLDGVRVKVSRAKFHAQALDKELLGLFPNGNYIIAPEIHDNGLCHVFRANQPPEADPSWSAIVGDCLHNLRSALDHLAYQLVRVSGGTPNIHTQFPIAPTVRSVRGSSFGTSLRCQTYPGESGRR